MKTNNTVYRFVINDGTPKKEPTKEEIKQSNEMYAKVLMAVATKRHEYYIKRAKQLGIKLTKFGNEYIITKETKDIIDKDDFNKLPKWEQEEIMRGGW